MSSTTIALWATMAVLLFWGVGAHNRLVGLRNELVRGFGPVDEQFRHRHALLLRLAESLNAPEAPAVEALRAACAQAESACAHARAHPGAAGAVTSLRMAEEILLEARQRLPAPWLAQSAAAAMSDELAAGDTTLGFARRQFNERVLAYNQAVQQFPTWIVAGLFHFHAASTL